MKRFIVSGIQQMGIGVRDLHEAWKWYIRAFGTDCLIFEDDAVARIMLPYTGGEPRSRHAVLTMNLQGGGGFEVWQYKGREPQDRTQQTRVGDLGIFSCKIKVKDAQQAYDNFRKKNIEVSGEPVTDPSGKKSFFVIDPYKNYFHIVEASDWFMDLRLDTGGAYGAVIGVSDADRSARFYTEILGYDKVIYDVTGAFGDLAGVPGGNEMYRRVLLGRSEPSVGAFSKLFGGSLIELVEAKEGKREKIYDGRFWGDPGFIHICYDINGMDSLRDHCSEKGFAFTVDSKHSHEGNSFDMGEAAGHFAYTEDPDGTLIEFVETHKIPIMKKLGWYLDLRKRDPRKSLPEWMIKTLRFSRVR